MPIDGIKVPGHFTTGTCRGYVMDAKYVKGGYIVVNEYNDLATLTDEVPGSIITGSPVYVVADNMTYRAIYDEQSDTFSWEQDTADQQEISAEILSLQKDVNSIGQALQLKANVSDIPTSLSQLSNTETGYITADVENLKNYYTKPEIDAKLNEVSSEIIWDDTTPVDNPIGNIQQNANLAGLTLKQILSQIFYTANVPTLTPPQLNVTSSVTSGVASQPLTVTITATFDRGKIEPAFGTSGFRSGLPISYSIGGVSHISSELTFTTDYTFDALSVGNNPIDVIVFYAEGEQPKNSNGYPYESPLPAGTLSQEINIIGVAGLFVGTSEDDVVEVPMSDTPIIGNPQETQTQQGMFEEYNDEHVLTGSGYQIVTPPCIERNTYPTVLIPAGLQILGVKIVDQLGNTWAWEYGSPEASLTSWQIEYNAVQKEIGGVQVWYDKYTYNMPIGGECSFRFFTFLLKEESN